MLTIKILLIALLGCDFEYDYLKEGHSLKQSEKIFKQNIKCKTEYIKDYTKGIKND